MTDIVIARRPASIKPSPSIAARALVTQLRAEGREIIDFTLGESDFDTPPHIVEAAYQAARSGETRYTSSNGTKALRAAIVGKFARENGIDFTEAQVVVGCGAKQLIHAAFAATLDEGDEVIVPTPYWVSYPDMAVVNGGVPVIVPVGEETGFKLTPALLGSAITPRAKWLVLNSPNNPSGAVYTPEEIASLAAVLEQHPQVMLMTDEIYEHFVYDGQTAAAFTRVAPQLAGRTLVINGVSKAYAMTGWRIGYAAGPLKLIETITLLLSQSTTCPSSVSQAAAVAALNGDQSFVREANAIYETRRDRIVGLLDAIPGITCARPAGAFYVYPNVSGLLGKRTSDGTTLNSDLDVSLFLLQEAGVAVIDGSSYGLSPYIRISFATSLDTIDAGCAQFRRAVESLA
ncbi:aminotransferase class I/II-fold pyridoxal phosphate-dependent enzyme [Methylobacterium nodulans]|uniref:Aminotransferase n=1 Tax=Methylobacterium nodulans (strain LMG 21967 / CNCM I-2342 / ORS 2060) TaxID=460265 RepID=B8IGL2_METNO|nr:aminotransferase class I/II-fold pyridoxal phosphate-dependent enzyme [Methylobacterium nodulans]ACL55912.1 aminotransferase class I and II [Methylobacterium nodulans ORS 2060]